MLPPISRRCLAGTIRTAVLAFLAVVTLAIPASAQGGYQQTDLTTDDQSVLTSLGYAPALNVDPSLINPWGVSFGPTGPFWISDNGTGLTTLYDTTGVKQGLVVTIPPPAGSPVGTTSTPTGQVFNGDATQFIVTGPGGSGAAAFIFAGEDGTITAWNPKANLFNAILEADRSQTPTASKGAVYKGLASATNLFGTFLYATNFRAGTVDVFDSKFAFLGSFTDRRIPAGYAPFGIQNINGYLVVTFAKQDAAKHDDVAGPGKGFVDVFDSFGDLRSHFAARGPLNSPWGIALAPSNFGRYSNALLIGNFGDGRINAYRVRNGEYLGPLKNARGRPIAIDGLWALIFGNGGSGGLTDSLYFTAGIDNEQHGLFGSLTALPGGRGDGDGDDHGGDNGGDGHRGR